MVRAGREVHGVEAQPGGIGVVLALLAVLFSPVDGVNLRQPPYPSILSDQSSQADHIRVCQPTVTNIFSFYQTVKLKR